MPRSALKVTVVVGGGGGGVESKFSVQLSPKLNNLLTLDKEGKHI